MWGLFRWSGSLVLIATLAWAAICLYYHVDNNIRTTDFHNQEAWKDISSRQDTQGTLVNRVHEGLHYLSTELTQLRNAQMRTMQLMKSYVQAQADEGGSVEMADESGSVEMAEEEEAPSSASSTSTATTASSADSGDWWTEMLATPTTPTIAGAEVEQPAVEPTPAAEPVVEPVVEPAVEPVVEPAVEPAVEPVVEPAVEPAVEPVVEPAVEPAAESVVEPVAEPVVEPATETEVSAAPHVASVDPSLEQYRAELNRKKVRELELMLRSKGRTPVGNKADLIQLILDLP